jgi:predicted MPP superfamily phosphohydrolase
LGDVSESNTRVLLNHYPTAVERITEDGFDLVLAGHTHGGQINVPFFTIDNESKYQRGLYKYGEGHLHVTPGLGTYFINARFLCRPEISVIAM